MTNFDFLKSDPQFNTFSDVAVAAEKIIHIDPAVKSNVEKIIADSCVIIYYVIS